MQNIEHLHEATVDFHTKQGMIFEFKNLTKKINLENFLQLLSFKI